MLVEFGFPLKGQDTNWSVVQQPPLTTSDSQNVRPYDILENRARGGQRPGLEKLYSQQIGGAAQRIDYIIQISHVS